MANSFYTPSAIAKEMVRRLETNLVLAKKVNKDFSKEFKMVGSDVKVRRPVRFLGQDNNLDLTSYVEDIEQSYVTLTLDNTWSDKITVSAIDRTLSFDRWSEDVIKPMAERAAFKIESAIASTYSGVYLYDGTPGTVPSTFASLADAGAIMSDAGISMFDRFAVHSPTAGAKLADGVKGVYVQSIAKDALEKASIGSYGGFDNYISNFTPTHTVGVATGTPLVNGGSQNVTYAASKNTWTQSLVTDGWTNSTTGILKAGDVFTIAGVYMVDPSTRATTPRLQTFVVTADANSGASTGPATLTISPPIITSGPYKTVSAAPADNAAITVKGTGGTAYRQSLLLVPDAITLVTRPLDIPNDGSLKTYTQSGNAVTLSVTEWQDGNTLAHYMRFDMLFKAALLDPRKAMRLTN